MPDLLASREHAANVTRANDARSKDCPRFIGAVRASVFLEGDGYSRVNTPSAPTTFLCAVEDVLADTIRLRQLSGPFWSHICGVEMSGVADFV